MSEYINILKEDLEFLIEGYEVLLDYFVLGTSRPVGVTLKGYKKEIKNIKERYNV